MIHLNSFKFQKGLDLITPIASDSDKTFNFLNYTQEQYDSIVKWKTAFYSFVLPIQSSLYLANINDSNVHLKCKEILNEMVNYSKQNIYYFFYSKSFSN